MAETDEDLQDAYVGLQLLEEWSDGLQGDNTAEIEKIKNDFNEFKSEMKSLYDLKKAIIDKKKEDSA